MIDRNAPDYRLPDLAGMLAVVAEHLMAQGVAATDGQTCQYRGAEGRVCAIGALLPDRLYSPNMEGEPGGRVLVKTGLVLGWDDERTGLADELQRIHDVAAGLPAVAARPLWASELARLAHQRGLPVPECLNAYTRD